MEKETNINYKKITAPNAFLKKGTAGLGLFLFSSAFTFADALQSGKPNILFILTDDQGWSDFSTALDPKYPEAACSYFETPNMNRFAQEGIRFLSGYAPAPMCTPTRRSIQFGMTPARQRGTEFLGQFSPKGHKSIAQYIKQADSSYRCAVFGKWGEAMSGTWTNQNLEANPDVLGYDESDGPHTGNVTGTYYHPKLGAEMEARNYICESDPDPKRTFSVTERAISFMRRRVEKKQPFYLQVNYYAIHTAYQALQTTMDKHAKKTGFPQRQVSKEIAPMLEDLDAGIGELLQAVDSLGLGDNTYIVLSSDNGGEFFKGKRPEAFGSLPQRNAPLLFVKGMLYEGGIRVPFIVRGPGIQPGAICREPVALYDLLPTFYELAGGCGPLPDDIDGGSLCPLFEHPEAGTVNRQLSGLVFHRPLVKRRPVSALRLGDYKLIVNWAGPWKVKNRELYNLTEDIGETKNLADQLPGKTDEMTELLVSYLRSVNAEVAELFEK